ncbi:hypothetical protein HSIEG1_3420 [Enterococcus sp. HSIEG1]|nr:hypothetical protein HSIEG1_3420 [Enterococcus sp. HSIEG1]
MKIANNKPILFVYKKMNEPRIFIKQEAYQVMKKNKNSLSLF